MVEDWETLPSSLFYPTFLVHTFQKTKDSMRCMPSELMEHSCVSSKKAYPVSLHSKTLAPKALDELYLGLSNISSETLHVLFHIWNALSPLAHF